MAILFFFWFAPPPLQTKKKIKKPFQGEFFLYLNVDLSALLQRCNIPNFRTLVFMGRKKIDFNPQK